MADFCDICPNYGERDCALVDLEGVKKRVRRVAVGRALLQVFSGFGYGGMHFMPNTNLGELGGTKPERRFAVEIAENQVSVCVEQFVDRVATGIVIPETPEGL